MSAVHNHSPHRPVCNERVVGACMVTIAPADIPHLGDFADDPREALNIIADNVRDIAEGDLDATEQIIRWFADLMPKPPKPAEPTGLGAVVRDSDRLTWVRAATGHNGRGRDWLLIGSREYQTYSDINAVEVVSKGVTA